MADLDPILPAVRPTAREGALLEEIGLRLGWPPDLLDAIAIEGPERLLPSVVDVTALAAASVAAATAAVADLLAARRGEARRAVRVDRRHAIAAFRSERYLTSIGWEIPPPWDPIAGDYRARDGCIRLHTNYASHRAAALAALGVPCERARVEAAVAERGVEELEDAVVAGGGAAAAMRSAAAWAAHPQGEAVAREPAIAVEIAPARASSRPLPPAPPGAPLGGLRVLDLTRVIAGPIATRVLAAWGADVLRIDPPGFEEIGALMAETTAGKRRAALDLRAQADRQTFERLVREAHLVVLGYRPDALEKLGLGVAALRAISPSLVIIRHDAYGWSGPWRERRGFDSLVQMSCGLADGGRRIGGGERPHPLPAQALDHATGYLIAAAACSLLARRVRSDEVCEARLSLARTAHILAAWVDDEPPGADFTAADAEPWLEDAATGFGPARRVRCPGGIEGLTPTWTLAAGPLGCDPPEWPSPSRF